MSADLRRFLLKCRLKIRVPSGIHVKVSRHLDYLAKILESISIHHSCCNVVKIAQFPNPTSTVSNFQTGSHLVFMLHHGRFAACCAMDNLVRYAMHGILAVGLSGSKSVITACLHFHDFSQVFWLLSAVTWIIYSMLFQGECGMENHVMQYLQYGGLMSVASCCSMDGLL